MIEEKLYAERMSSQDEKIENILKRLDNYSERLKNLELALVRLEKDQCKFLDLLERLEKTVEKLISVVEELKEKPLRRWEQVTMYVLTTILGLLLGFIFRQLF